MKSSSLSSYSVFVDDELSTEDLARSSQGGEGGQRKLFVGGLAQVSMTVQF